MRFLPPLLLLFLFPFRVWAQEADPDKAELRHLHAELIRAHLEDRVDLWMSIEAEDLIAVNRGRVTFPSPAERRAQRSAYLESTTFATYRDLREPIVRISEDGSLGWLIAEVEISGSTAGTDGEPESFHQVWAWVELYQKIEGRWRLVGNVSNRR